MKASFTDIQAIVSVVNRQNRRTPEQVIRFLECISDLHAKLDESYIEDAFFHFEMNALDEGKPFVLAVIDRDNYFVDLIDGTKMMELVSKNWTMTLEDIVKSVKHFVETPLPMDEVEHAIEYHNDILLNDN